MIRRPPRSTLFPTRRSSDLPLAPGPRRPASRLRARRLTTASVLPSNNGRQETKRSAQVDGAGRDRSEEHTSELQSRQYLVCRLLLEKTKYSGKTYNRS